MRVVIRAALLIALAGLCLCQYTPPASSSSGNATTVNGAAVPPSSLLASNSSRQIVDNGRIVPTQAQRPFGGLPAEYFAFTDGSGTTAPGACVVFTGDFAGNMIAGSDFGVNCITGTSGVFSVLPGETLQPNGAGIIKANSLTQSSGSQPACSSATRFRLWMTAGGAGVKDGVSVCVKDAGDAYSWAAVY